MNPVHAITSEPDTSALDTRTDLWPHQRDAVDAAVKTLHDETRATVVAACGAGKTRIGGQIAVQLVPAGGRLLIIAPTLDLIAQTLGEYESWSGRAALGRLVAVCSDRDAVSYSTEDLAARHVAVTTDPAVLAEVLAEPGRATVACTYQSLGVLRTAHAEHGLGAWSLVIVDEAHRSAGARGKAWALIHDDTAIPARRRLYLTATPRLLGEERDDAVGMDDERVFGPTCHRLTFAEAIERGLLADYRVLVPVITDAAVRALVADAAQDAPHLTAGRFAVSAEMLATQIAVLRAVHEHEVRRMVTFHHRVADATAFATSLPAAAELLDAHERPARLAAFEIDGYQQPEQRRTILRHLGTNDPGVVVVANARVLAEGVNVPAIDAVAFIDARDSPESTAQAVGRALRLGGRRGKIATIIVPVLLHPDETPEAALDGSAYASVWHTIRALCTHDERLAERLDTARFELALRDYQPVSEIARMPDWFSLTGVPVPDGFARAVSIRMVQATTSPWHEGYAHAHAFHAEHGHLLPGSEDEQLNRWLIRQRVRRKHDDLSADRIARLDQLGMVWDTREQEWESALAIARAYRAAHGHLDPSSDESWADPPFPIGSWVVQLRARHRRGAVPADRVAALDMLGISWNPLAEKWADHLATARAYHAEYGHINVPSVLHWGEPARALGDFVAHQRRLYRKGRLPADRVAALEELGISWDELWWRNLAAVEAYQQECGHLRAPGSLRVGQPPFLLCAWLSQQRADRRAGQLSAGQIAALDRLGMVWDVRDQAWQAGLAAAQACHRERGSLTVTSTEAFGEPPVRLSTWLSRIRRKRAEGELTGDQIAQLDALGMVWDLQHQFWAGRLHALRDYLNAHAGAAPTKTDPMGGDPAVNLHTWLRTERRAQRTGTLPARRAEQLAQLLGPYWAGP